MTSAGPPGPLLLTGFPGFLGSRLLPRLLRRAQGIFDEEVAKLRLAKPQNARVTFTYPINFQPTK